MENKHIVIYGANGYTGRLIAEYCRELRIPFIAAGRDAEKLAEVIGKVPGIEDVEHEIVAVEHTVEALTELFRGATLVSNTVGPFIQYGDTVVEAALNAGVHYSDTTGEQDWMIHAESKWGAKFAEAGLLLSPGIAQMYTTGEIAANIALETPGMDTLDMVVFWKGLPTFASTQTIFTILKADWFYLEHNEYVQWPLTTKREVVVPGQHETAIAVPWGGTAHPVWFKNDPRVANVKALGGVFNTPLMQGVPEIVKQALAATEGMNDDDKYAALTQTAAQVQSEMPPRENARVNKSVDSVHAQGPLGRGHCVIYGNSNYKQTGLLQAYVAYSLLQQEPKRVGFASGCQAFGHRELLGVLREFGLVAEPQITFNQA